MIWERRSADPYPEQIRGGEVASGANFPDRDPGTEYFERSVTDPKRSPIVAGLIAWRAELAGVIVQLQHQLEQHRADLSHVVGVLRILATDLDPETIKPKRAYRRSHYFERRELSRLCLTVLRTASEPLSIDDLAERAGLILLPDPACVDSPSGRVSSQRLCWSGTVENAGTKRASKSKLARA